VQTIYLKMKGLDFFVVKNLYFCSFVHVNGHGSQEDRLIIRVFSKFIFVQDIGPIYVSFNQR